MSNTFSGKIWKLREDVDTDIIIPTQYVALETVEEMSKHAFEPLRPDLARKIQPGDIIVAGKNFGCGSSREMAAEVLVALNIKCIIAESFARIFFRNAINNGIYLIENKDIYFNCNEGDNLKVIINDKIICNDKEYKIPNIPENLLEIIEDGGLIKSMQKRNGIL